MTTTQTQFLSELKALLRKWQVELEAESSWGGEDLSISASFEGSNDVIDMGRVFSYDKEPPVESPEPVGYVTIGGLQIFFDENGKAKPVLWTCSQIIDHPASMKLGLEFEAEWRGCKFNCTVIGAEPEIGGVCEKIMVSAYPIIPPGIEIKLKRA